MLNTFRAVKSVTVTVLTYMFDFKINSNIFNAVLCFHFMFTFGKNTKLNLLGFSCVVYYADEN